MKEFGGGVEVVGLKAVSPRYICDREQWQYAQAAAAKSVLTGGFDGSSILTEQGRAMVLVGVSNGLTPEWSITPTVRRRCKSTNARRVVLPPYTGNYLNAAYPLRRRIRKAAA